MQAGKLNRRVTVQRVSETQNTFGEVTETWTHLVSTWAQWLPLKGTEKFTARQFAPELSGEFRMRYRELTPKDRIVMDGRIFDVEGVIDVDDRRRELRCTVEELV